MRAVVLLAIIAVSSGLNVGVAVDDRPVSKVVGLIKDMMKTLEKEAEEDEEIYDKLMCWCETYDKLKAAAIVEAEAKIKQLTKVIEETSGRVAQLTAEIENLVKEVTKSQAALDKADAIRQQELADFVAEEKDSLQAISALKSAITVLNKHHGASFLQTEAHMSTVVNAIHIVAWKSKGMYVPLEHQKILNAFLEENGSKDFFDAKPIGGGSYAPQSGAIFGILKQMQETFESGLSEAQKNEQAAVAAFAQLKEAKEEEIQAGTDQINTKKEELAAAKNTLEESKVSLEDTKAELTEDEKFLAMLKEKCSMTDGEWEERQKARQLEIEACSKALAILNSDEAHATFSRTFNGEPASFMQTSSSARKEASEVLRAVHSPKLAAIALKVKLDAFEQVKKAIDDMIADLTKQMTDEVKQRDWCIAELNKNDADQTSTKRDIKDAQIKINKLDEAIFNCEKTIDESTKAIADTEKMMKEAGVEREAENAEFQTTVKDQKASIALLKQALAVLEKAYAAFVQEAPPAGFKEYKKNSQGSGVVQMIKDIIYDADQMLKKAEEDEARSQAEYEKLVTESNANIDEFENTIKSETEAKAAHEQDKVDTTELQESKLQEMTELKTTAEDLHAECDFLMENFENRQKSRQSEIDALNKAKGILSGAKFEE